MPSIVGAYSLENTMKWIKDNGQEIETNDMEGTVEYCKSIGWKPMEDKQEVEEIKEEIKEEKKKPGRPKKSEE